MKRQTKTVMNIKRNKLLLTLILSSGLLINSLSYSAEFMVHNISGVNFELNNKISEQLKSEYSNLNNTTEPLSSDNLDQIKKAVIDILAVNGYYSPEVKLFKSKKNNINIVIKPGKPVIIKSISINVINNNQNNNSDNITNTKNKNSNQTLTEINKIIKDYKLQKNNILNQDTYKEFKENLIESAHNNGYLDANYVEHNILIDRKKHTANIIITVDLKQLYYLNLITVDIKSTKFNPNTNPVQNNKFVFRFLPYDYTIINANQAKAINTPYRSQDVLEIQNGLNNYFRENDIQTNINQQNQTVDLVFNITPVKNYFYNIGLGFSTDEGPRAFGGLQIRNITSNRHKLDVQGKIAQYRELFETNYILPGYKPATDIVSIGYQFRSDKKRSSKNIEKERHQATTQYQTSFNAGKLLLIGGISYRMEKFTDFKKFNSISSELFAPYFIYDQILTDNRIQTTQGHHINIRIEGADRDILSDTSFIRLHAKAKSIIPIKLHKSITGLRFIAKGQFGQVWHQEQEKIPPTLRFFAGGSDTVRGYRFESLGPSQLNAKGKPVIVGGDRLLAASAELEKTIYKKWSTAVFYDVGNALDSWHDLSKNLNAGAGGGIRWQSPLGPIRLDIANALDKPGRPWRIDLNMGTDL